MESLPDTLVVVQAFAGYAQMVQDNLSLWTHHNFPVMVTSPTDSFCPVNGPGGRVWAEPLGKAGHVGPESLDRLRAILQFMLRTPFAFFLLHESDSVCLDPQLPRYCYEQSPVVWSNEMADNGRPATQQFYALAPLFLPRAAVKRLLEVSRTSADRPPYHGDRWLGQMMEVGPIAHKAFSPGIGCGTLSFQERPAEVFQVGAAVRAGASMIHGIKSPDVRDYLVQQYRQCRNS